ncbi:uncharacterized protein KZ484_010672 [Pholidichthys leucotaenia]
MNWTRGISTFICTASIYLTLSCAAGHALPAPTNISYKWLDPFTFMLSFNWEKPSNLPHGCEIKYQLELVRPEKTHTSQTGEAITLLNHFSLGYLTEEMDSDHWEFNLRALGFGNSCKDRKSRKVKIFVNTTKPRAKVVEDFKCVMSEEMNCSWIPVDQSLKLNVSYRHCGESEEDLRILNACDHFYSSGKRNGCYLKGYNHQRDMCVLVETETGMSTFKPKLVADWPKLNITEKGDSLYLTWRRRGQGFGNCDLKYMLCYKECKHFKACLTITLSKQDEGQRHMKIPFNEQCEYEFHYNVTTVHCKKVESNKRVETYGRNASPDRTLTVISVIVPLLLCACVILSCCCFRRYSNIICPVIPDPSAIFKEMISGSKEPKTTQGNLYTPVPEPMDELKITTVMENSVPQQNS